MKIKKFKESKRYKAIIAKDLKLYATYKTIYSKKEIRVLTTLDSKYVMLFKRKVNIEIVIPKLLDTLMTSSSYYERLTLIKNALLEHRRAAADLEDNVLSLVFTNSEFLALRKHDKDVIIKSFLKDFKTAIAIQQSIQIIDNGLTSLDKLQFNLKSAVSLLKTKIEAG